MRRSFPIFAFIFATLLPNITFAGEPDPLLFELPQWTPRDIQVNPGECVAQYDGLTSKRWGAPQRWWESIGTPAAVTKLCQQYTRNKGWTLPDYSSCRGDGRDGAGQLHYYCYCMREAVVTCNGSGKTGQAPARRDKPKVNLAGALDKTIELVDAIGRAILYARAHPDTLGTVKLDGPTRSETRYRSSSSHADELYEEGMAAYAKPSHTDEETVEALTSFGACIEKDPTHVPCLWELGWVLYVNGHYGQTKVLWDRVKQIDPDHKDVDEQLRELQKKL